MLEGLNVLVTAQDWLSHYLTTPLLESSARATHEQWRATKTKARLDPDNPYQGWGPQRLRVADLNFEQMAAFNVTDDTAFDADVYHSLDVSFDKLDGDTRSKNVAPMVTLCNALGDLILPEGSELAALEQALDEFLQGTNPKLTNFLRRLHHLVYATNEVTRSNSRSAGVHRHYTPVLYSELSPEIQDLDEITLRPVAETMLSHLRNAQWSALTIGFLHGQRLLDGVSTTELHTIKFHPDFNQLTKDSPMGTTSLETPEFWPTVEAVFKEIAAGVVEEVFYDDTTKKGNHKVGVVVYNLNPASEYVVGRALDALMSQHELPVRLGKVRGATARPSMPSTCPTCQTSWANCRRRSDHQYDARQAGIYRG